MAPRKRARYNSSALWKRAQTRATGMTMTAPQRGYMRNVGYYGRYNIGNPRAAGEDKFLDTDIDILLPGLVTTEAKANLCIVGQGAGESQRIGRKIRVSSIIALLVMTKASVVDVDLTGNLSKISIVQDKQTNGTAYNTVDRITPDNIVRFNNLSDAARFRVLREKVQTWNVNGAVPSAAAGEWPAQIKYVKIVIKTNIVIEYNGATGGVTEQRSNSIWFAQIALAVSELNIINGQVRIRYRDV